MGWLITIILGGLAGWIAERIMKADTGLLMNIILGIVGAAVLNFLLSTIFGLYPADNWFAYLVVAIVGACGLIFVWRAIAGRN
ncbi:GlsB/YeaQ/YmgE family stress response membrane protein [Palleronia sediminis]|uniref:GlsB/YeaQ/YmgE family stress response membrane protein n=1 Tax=Palleronia sediminis TaxID=2547833 RepID=A0A4R6A6S3_9RHOB|nr:GlsB/YeaQ/YmgE family stress response membrane protein [Palleronia sediminis]TDL78424.1 GlsB/YeaQ/YmgE family stress response membrane protein [Palleronia sediminis]